MLTLLEPECAVIVIRHVWFLPILIDYVSIMVMFLPFGVEVQYPQFGSFSKPSSYWHACNPNISTPKFLMLRSGHCLNYALAFGTN
jgi:hypothetical protein